MKTIAKIALITFFWLSVTNSGTITTLDTQLRLNMSHAWWTKNVEVDSDYQPRSRTDIVVGVLGKEEKRYIPYDPGQSLLMLPGDWLGTKLYRIFPLLGSRNLLRPLIVNFVIFIPINIAVVIACFWLLNLFDFNERIASLASLTWLLGTTVLQYTQMIQQNHQILLCIILSYASSLACIKSNKSYFALWSGLALGIAILIRKDSIFHAMIEFIFLVSCLFYQNKIDSNLNIAPDTISIPKPSRKNNNINLLKNLQFKTKYQIIIWILGCLPLFLLGRIYDYFRFGHLFGIAGNSENLNSDPIFTNLAKLPVNYPFTNEPQIGILGVLFSPAKSIFIYDPLLIPCLVLAIISWRQLSVYLKLYLIAILVDFCAYLILTSQMDFWHGDWAWGARYHLTSIHLLLIPLLALLIQKILSMQGLKLWGMRMILSISIAIQFASVLLPSSLEIYQERIDLSRSFPSYQSRLNFRLGKRFINLGCLIDSNIASTCIENSYSDARSKLNFEKQLNTIYFFPFIVQKLSQEDPPLAKVVPILFLVWILGSIAAIMATIHFMFVQ